MAENDEDPENLKIEKALQFAMTVPELKKEISDLLFDYLLEDFDKLPPAVQEDLLKLLKEKALIS